MLTQSESVEIIHALRETSLISSETHKVLLEHAHKLKEYKHVDFSTRSTLFNSASIIEYITSRDGKLLLSHEEETEKFTRGWVSLSPQLTGTEIKERYPEEWNQYINSLNHLLERQVLSTEEYSFILEKLERTLWPNDLSHFLLEISNSLSQVNDPKHALYRYKAYLEYFKTDYILPQTKYQSLVDSFTVYDQIEPQKKIMPHLSNVCIFDSREFSLQSDYVVTCAEILERIQKICPLFHYTNLSIQVLEQDAYYQSTKVSLLVSVDIGSVSYSVVIYNYQPFPKIFRDTTDVIYELATLVNKYLSDLETPERIENISWHLQTDDWCILAFTSHFLPRAEIFFHRVYTHLLGTRKVNQAIEELRDNHFFDYLSEETFKEGLTKAQSVITDNYLGVLQCFGLCIDTLRYSRRNKHGRMDDYYTLFIQRLADISNGFFQPEDLFDTYQFAEDNEYNTFHVGFEMNGNLYEQRFYLKDPDSFYSNDSNLNLILNLANACLFHEKLSIVFYDIAGRIFALTENQYLFLKEKDPDVMSGENFLSKRDKLLEEHYNKNNS